MKKNQLTRALRIDKFTAATLEVVLQEYLSEEKAIQNIPALRMITKEIEEITRDAQELEALLQQAELRLRFRWSHVSHRLEEDLCRWRGSQVWL